MDVDCCSIRLSYSHRGGRADLNRQPTVPITHDLRPAENTTFDRPCGRLASSCIELSLAFHKISLYAASDRTHSKRFLCDQALALAAFSGLPAVTLAAAQTKKTLQHQQ